MQISEHRKTPLILIKQIGNVGRIKDYIFLDITTCRLIYIYILFGEACVLRFAILTRFYLEILLVKSDAIKTFQIKGR